MAGKTSQENGKKGGRPIASKTLIAQKIKERMAEKLYERMDPIIDAMLDKAEGVLLEVSTEGGKTYQRGHLPDSVAFKTLLEHVLGRPNQFVEVKEVGDGRFISARIQELADKIFKVN
jgi:hypothetical protein